MTNKNNWHLSGDYLYGLYYDFELSGTLAEKQQTYLQLLKDVLNAGNHSGLFCLHFKDQYSNDPDFMDTLAHVETLVNWDDMMNPPPEISSCFNPKGPHPYLFSSKMWFYTPAGQLVYKEYIRGQLNNFLNEIGYDGGWLAFLCFGMKVYFQRDFVTQSYRIPVCRVKLDIANTIWFPYRLWYGKVYYDNIELARLNCLQLDILLKGMGDLMSRYNGRCEIDDDNDGYKGAFITPQGIDWAEFDRQCKFYDYKDPFEGRMTIFQDREED